MSTDFPKRSSRFYSAESLKEDVLLWESVRKGNELAFSSLYKKYVQALFNYGMQIHPNREFIKDGIQELFTKFWTQRELLNPVEKVGFYLFRSFRNLLFHKMEGKSKSVGLDVDSVDFQSNDLAVELTWIETELVEERRLSLHRAINQLSPRQREVVLLRFFQSLEPKEIAEIMQISVAAVHNLLSKTIQSLRTKVKWVEILYLCLCFDHIG